MVGLLMEFYRQVGRPVRDEVFPCSDESPEKSAPEYLVEPICFSHISAEYLSEEVLLLDLGEACPVQSPPDNGVGTPVSYRSPELILENRASKYSDIWALACSIFEMRSGFPLFESFIGSSTEILKEMDQILGWPPESSCTIADNALLNTCILYDRAMEIGMDNRESSMPRLGPQTILLEPPGLGVSRDEAHDLAAKVIGLCARETFDGKVIASHQWLVTV
jgi:serine/threonine protein kinase